MHEAEAQAGADQTDSTTRLEHHSNPSHQHANSKGTVIRVELKRGDDADASVAVLLQVLQQQARSATSVLKKGSVSQHITHIAHIAHIAAHMV